MKFALFLLMAGAVLAAEIKLKWDENPPEQQVTSYEIKVSEVWGMKEATFKTPGTTATITELKTGEPYFFQVRAENVAGVSDYSPAITEIPLPRYKVTIQKSSSLGVWTDTDTVLTGPAYGSGFFRLKIELADEQGVVP